jgi:fermentation-respiration switch protein FrsA (DUF1100 family)
MANIPVAAMIWMAWFRVARALALALVVLALGAFVARQFNLLDRQLVFFPSKAIQSSPADLGLAYEEVRFKTEDGVDLHGWFVHGTGAGTLLWFHGNAGNIGDRVENILLLNRDVGVNIFIFDYRGYGLSEGSPSEKGMYLDAEAAIAYLKSRPEAINDGDIVLFGRSIGAAVAVEMATRHDFRGLILESPFTSLRAMARLTHPVLSRIVPFGLVVQGRYESLSKMPHVNSPVLVIHGKADETVPVKMGLELFEAASDPKRLHLVDGAGHNDVYLLGGEGYFNALKAFIEGDDG